MKEIYKSEIEGMQDFWQELEMLPDYSCNTDGKINGTLFEMKLEIKSYSEVEKQIKRYIRAYNATATSIPSKAIALDINQRKYNLYNISTNKDGNTSLQKIKEDCWVNATDFKDLINSTINQYSKGWICEESIVCYNNEYCKKYKNASKEKVKTEFINPQELYIYPFEWDTQLSIEMTDREQNNWLTFNMNMLGCSLLKKQQGSTIVTDTYHAYKDLKKYYKHKTVKHSAGEYVRIENKTAFKVHTNSIEGFWSLVKRTINGTHHWISKKHTNKYLGEMSFRYNTSDMQDNERFVAFLQTSFNKITYKELIRC